ncbi:DUF2997 domain-containing protein [Selenomonas ruminantium]|uniref:DUF2997 domain-containing protein n=1 Tax=Selenomonas ruminantium TaxID=971 RepID=UPI000479226C|nr:DUF2997 domain-containing protein [Selenomonas ruminantium]
MATMQIRIYPDGRVQGEIDGIKGKKCTDYIGIIEELTDSRTWQSNFTEEFYETEEVHTHQEQRDYEDDVVRTGQRNEW